MANTHIIIYTQSLLYLLTIAKLFIFFNAVLEELYISV